MAVTSSTLSRDVPSEAIAYYMHYHVLPPDGASRGAGDLREALLSAWTISPALELAVSSLSISIFSQVKRLPSVAPQALTSYQKSLGALQITLPTVCSGEVDACLLTICFLARYEDSIFAPSTSTGSAHSQSPRSQLHLAGILAVLEYWTIRCSSHQAPTFAIKYARRLLRKAALLGQADLPAWLADGGSFGECGREKELDDILVRLINARGHTRLLSEEEPVSRLCLPEMLSGLDTVDAELSNIDESLLAWMLASPPYTVHGLADERIRSETSFYHPCVYVHEDPSKAAVQIQCIGFRILTNHWRMRALETLEKQSSCIAAEMLCQCRHTMASLAYDLASSIPFCLGRLRILDNLGYVGDKVEIANSPNTTPYIAEQVAASLAIASTTPYISNHYGVWFGSQLADVGRLTGYGMMESVAPNGSWFKL